MMTRQFSVGLLLLIALLMNPLTLQAAGQQDPLVGKKTVNFTLSSTEDRAINYGSEYYDKAFLIITFFPAAYTPV
ncbi:MAG TPA: hypothetical protein VFG28_13820 [Syntrophales bacterium]|nr:hypothetical protein [Syntrophales bacterium]